MKAAREHTYFQERIVGPSFSALFIGEISRAHFIGVTRQLIGSTSSPFTYRGSIGPWQINRALAGRLKDMGNAIAVSFGLAGWFGVDLHLERRSSLAGRDQSALYCVGRSL